MKIPDYSKKRINKLKEIYNDYVREEDKELIRLTKEVDRLNNIIIKLEEYLIEAKENVKEVSFDGSSGLQMALDKLHELKESDKE